MQLTVRFAHPAQLAIVLKSLYATLTLILES